MRMKISFVIPAYNVENYIVDCVQSILSQNIEGNNLSVEAIVIDDGSTDQTLLKLKRFSNDARVRIISTVNCGVSHARNIGLNEATGEWVFFVDGDDFIDPDLLKMTENFLLDERNDVCFIGHFENTKNQDLLELRSKNSISGNAFLLDKNDFKEFIKATLNRDIKGKYDYHQLKMATPCKFYRRDLLLFHEISFPEKIKTGEDAIFNLNVYRVAKSGVYLPWKYYYHRVIPTSVSRKYNPFITMDFDDFHAVLRTIVENKPDLKKYYCERCLWSIGFCCRLDFLSPDNKKNYSKRKADFENYRNSYYNEITSVEFSDFRPAKRLMLWLIQKNCFCLLNLFSKFGIK